MDHHFEEEEKSQASAKVNQCQPTSLGLYFYSQDNLLQAKNLSFSLKLLSYTFRQQAVQNMIQLIKKKKLKEIGTKFSVTYSAQSEVLSLLLSFRADKGYTNEERLYTIVLFLSLHCFVAKPIHLPNVTC